MPPTPPPSKYVGLYHCTTDGLTYLVSHTDSKNQDLQMQRRAPNEIEWRPAYPVEEKHIKRLLDFSSFIRHQPC